MEITVRIEGLGELTEAIALLGSGLAVQKDVGEAVRDLTQVQEKVNKKRLLKEMKEVVDDGPKYSREEVRALFVGKNSKENRQRLKEILSKYGASSISDLKEEDFVSAVKDLEAV